MSSLVGTFRLLYTPIIHTVVSSLVPIQTPMAVIHPANVIKDDVKINGTNTPAILSAIR